MQKHKRLQLIDFIFLVSFVLELSQCLPVTSKALENNPEQLIWQTSWFSQEQGEDMGSPFIAKDLKKVKKITAKSIFILPDFEKNDKCDDGFKPDENGKCIRVASLSNRDDMLVTRWQNMDNPAHHRPTTDGSTDTDVDYDYISNENEKHSLKQPTQVVLPLSPIMESNDTVEQDTVNHQNLSTSIVENVIVNHDRAEEAEVDNYFREQDSKNVSIASNENVEFVNELHLMNKTDNSDKSEEQVTESESDKKDDINVSENEQIDDKHVYVYETEEYPTTMVSSDQQNESATNSNINQTEPEPTEPNTTENTTSWSSEITETGDLVDIPTTNLFIDYMDAMMLNESLLLLDSNSSEYSEKPEKDYYEFTTENSIETTTLDITLTETSTPEESTSLVYPSESSQNETLSMSDKRLEDMEPMQSNMISDKSDEENVTDNRSGSVTSSSPASPPMMKVAAVDPIMSKISLSLSPLIRFPTDDDHVETTYRERQPIKNIFNFKKVKFPDEPLPNRQTTMISWPRDNGYFNFWRDQPLINDSPAKAFSSNNLFSRGLFSILQNNNGQQSRSVV